MTEENENIRKAENAGQKQDEKKSGEWKLDMDNEVKTGRIILPKAARNLVIMVAVLAAVAVIFDMCR